MGNIPPTVQTILNKFEVLMGVLVVISAMNLFLEVELRGWVLNNLLKNGFLDSSRFSAAMTYFRYYEQIANVIFIAELSLRLSVLRSRFFWNEVQRQVEVLSCVDLAIVVLGSVDLYILPSVIAGASSGAAGNLTSIRLIRLLRLTRALRVVRVMTAFSRLRVLLVTTASSFLSLFWAMILMFLIIYGSALSLCQVLQSTIEDESVSMELRAWVYQWYGSGLRSLWTLYLITFSGGWPNYVQRLIDEVLDPPKGLVGGLTEHVRPGWVKAG